MTKNWLEYDQKNFTTTNLIIYIGFRRCPEKMSSFGGPTLKKKKKKKWFISLLAKTLALHTVTKPEVMSWLPSQKVLKFEVQNCENNWTEFDLASHNNKAYSYTGDYPCKLVGPVLTSHQGEDCHFCDTSKWCPPFHLFFLLKDIFVVSSL